MLGHQPNSVIYVDVDKDGVPLEKFWRRRLLDSKTDNCCEIVSQAQKAGKK